MNRLPSDEEPGLLRVTPTDGDFSHARKRGVRLACCTCTTCCFTLIGIGIGGLTGLVYGMVQNSVASAARKDSPWYIDVVRFVCFSLGYLIAGVLIGAALGFGIDMIFVFH